MKYLVEDCGFRFGPFDTLDAAYAWAKERARRVDEDKHSIIPRGAHFLLTELRPPCEWE